MKQWAKAIGIVLAFALLPLSWYGGYMVAKQDFDEQQASAYDAAHRATWTYNEHEFAGELIPCYTIQAPVGDSASTAHLCDKGGVKYHGTH